MHTRYIRRGSGCARWSTHPSHLPHAPSRPSPLSPAPSRPSLRPFPPYAPSLHRSTIPLFGPMQFLNLLTHSNVHGIQGRTDANNIGYRSLAYSTTCACGARDCAKARQVDEEKEEPFRETPPFILEGGEASKATLIARGDGCMFPRVSPYPAPHNCVAEHCTEYCTESPSTAPNVLFYSTALQIASLHHHC